MSKVLLIEDDDVIARAGDAATRVVVGDTTGFAWSWARAQGTASGQPMTATAFAHGPVAALDAWETMLPTAQRMAELLDGVVLDESRNALGRQRIAHGARLGVDREVRVAPGHVELAMAEDLLRGRETLRVVYPDDEIVYRDTNAPLSAVTIRSTRPRITAPICERVAGVSRIACAIGHLSCGRRSPEVV